MGCAISILPRDGHRLDPLCARDGTSIEVSLVGDEGVIGLPIILRSHGFPYRIIVQGPGIAWRMKADLFRKEFDRCASLHKLVLHYAHVLIVQLSQSSACNRFHTIRQRLCRWLLTAQDARDPLSPFHSRASVADVGSKSRQRQPSGQLLAEGGLIRYTVAASPS